MSTDGRRVPRPARAAVVATLVVVVGGCAQQESPSGAALITPPHSARTTTTPMAPARATTEPATASTTTGSTTAGSVQVAFAQAEAALRRHVDLLDVLGRDPTDQNVLSRLAETSNGKEFARQNATYRYKWGPQGIHLRDGGATVVRRVERLKADLTGRDHPTVSLQVCLDGTRTIAVDRTGEPIADPAAPPMADLTYTLTRDPDGVWRINDSEGGGTSLC